MFAVPSAGDTMRKRVVFVARSNVFGGTEKTLIDCLVRFDLKRVKPIVMCFGGDPYGPRFAAYSRVDVDLYGGVPWWGATALWLRLMRLKPFSVVFVNSYRGLFPWTSYLAAKLTCAKRVCAIEQLLSEDAEAPIEPTGLINRMRRLVGRRARYRYRAELAGRLRDLTICVSDAVRTKLISEWNYPNEAMVTIRNGTDLSYNISLTNNKRSGSVRTAFGIPENDPVLLCVARLSEQKGIAILLKALSLLRSPGLRIWTIVVGDGPLREELKALAADLRLESSLFFAGHHEDVRPFYEAATIFVLPSLIEGFPLVLLEAMAYGLPSVVTDVGGVKEAVSHGVDGLIVPPASPEALGGAIERLLDNDQERMSIGINARQKAEKQFDIEVTARETQAAVLGAET